MTFTLDYTHRALRDLKGLERQEARRITAHLKMLEAQEMPWLHAKKLRTSPSQEPVYSVHVGPGSTSSCRPWWTPPACQPVQITSIVSGMSSMA